MLKAVVANSINSPSNQANAIIIDIIIIRINIIFKRKVNRRFDGVCSFRRRNGVVNIVLNLYAFYCSGFITMVYALLFNTVNDTFFIISIKIPSGQERR
eukprot:m.62406 g.62406  ORF g.62406 m.62406 type:complete len:99 (+) comp8030_c2_seq2:1835-2131(+)